MTLRLSTPDREGILRVSKSLKYQVLLDDREMKDFLEYLEPFHIYIVSEMTDNRETPLSLFLERYSSYIQTLKRGDIPDEKMLKPYFSSIFTASNDILYAMEVKPSRFLIKAIRPVIQLQAHQFFFSRVDEKFHPMVLGKESVTWGIQFSYPQVFQHPQTHLFSKIDQSLEFPNTALFLRLVHWMRRHTAPTPFLKGDKPTYVPIRIGKQCFPWISMHPQLSAQQLAIYGS